MYMGGEGLYTPTFEHARREDCVVCSENAEAIRMTVATETLNQFMSLLADHPIYQLKQVDMITGGSGDTKKTLYTRIIPNLREQTEWMLKKPLRELVPDGEILYINAPCLADTCLQLEIHFC
jgi:ubiquitin-activating enzyme E1 C